MKLNLLCFQFIAFQNINLSQTQRNRFVINKAIKLINPPKYYLYNEAWITVITYALQSNIAVQIERQDIHFSAEFCLKDMLPKWLVSLRPLLLQKACQLTHYQKHVWALCPKKAIFLYYILLLWKYLLLRLLIWLTLIQGW